MSLLYDMILHLFNSFTTIVYYTGVMKVKKKGKWINEAGLVLSLFVSAIVSHILRYNPPVRFIGVLTVMLFTVMAFFEASFTNRIRTTAESILLSMTGELFGLGVYGITVKNGFNTMEYDSPDRAVMSLVVSAIVAGMVPVAILWRKKAKLRELWSGVMFQLAIVFTQISMIMIAYFGAAEPSAQLVFMLMLIQIPGIIISLFCTRAIMAITNFTIGEREKEFEKTKADMEYDYYKLAMESNTKLSMLRHDMSNTLQTAMTLMSNGEFLKGDKLLHEIDKENRSTAPVIFCDNEIINVIITLKHEEMKKHGISFKANVKTELCDMPVSERELTSVITNLLDNAVEACLECDDKREINITFGHQQGFYIIKVENSFNKKKAYIPESVADAVSTKDNKELHGFGLRSVYEISKNHDGNFGMYEEDGMVVSIVTFAENN